MAEGGCFSSINRAGDFRKIVQRAGQAEKSRVTFSETDRGGRVKSAAPQMVPFWSFAGGGENLCPMAVVALSGARSWSAPVLDAWWERSVTCSLNP